VRYFIAHAVRSECASSPLDFLELPSGLPQLRTGLREIFVPAVVLPTQVAARLDAATAPGPGPCPGSKVRTPFEDAHPNSKVRILENPGDFFEGAHPFPRCAPKSEHLRRLSPCMYKLSLIFGGRSAIVRPRQKIGVELAWYSEPVGRGKSPVCRLVLPPVRIENGKTNTALAQVSAC